MPFVSYHSAIKLNLKICISIKKKNYCTIQISLQSPLFLEIKCFIKIQQQAYFQMEDLTQHKQIIQQSYKLFKIFGRKKKSHFSKIIIELERSSQFNQIIQNQELLKRNMICIQIVLILSYQVGTQNYNLA
ncbi:unnamed protein product [Paramecium pentaurelia]|uniref:Uncharacterized protein n=1 Tax=Paramecium pentaurelia TaxID=43138 RepID=A0A8S1U9M1_9CILI|nr:unnamed protein product [Paramecium pentaurelia]